MSEVANIVTAAAHIDEPENWHRCEWVTQRQGSRVLRYQTDYDLSIFLRNVAVAGALELAFRHGLALGDVARSSRSAYAPGGAFYGDEL